MRLFVPLTRVEFDTLRELALNERRRPQDQAAVILAQALASAQPRTKVENTQPIDNQDSRRHREVANAAA